MPALIKYAIIGYDEGEPFLFRGYFKTREEAEKILNEVNEQIVTDWKLTISLCITR